MRQSCFFMLLKQIVLKYKEGYKLDKSSKVDHLIMPKLLKYKLKGIYLPSMSEAPINARIQEEYTLNHCRIN